MGTAFAKEHLFSAISLAPLKLGASGNRGSGATFTAIAAVLGFNFIWANGMHCATFTLFGLETGYVPQGPTTPDLE